MGSKFNKNSLDTNLFQSPAINYYVNVLEDNVLLKYNNSQYFATLRGVSQQYLKSKETETSKVREFMEDAGLSQMATTTFGTKLTTANQTFVDEEGNTKLLKGKELERVVFNEITKSAILNAIKNPRDIELPLVEAYLARRALDYLVGFNISPILWKKISQNTNFWPLLSIYFLKFLNKQDENRVPTVKCSELRQWQLN
mgnify:CR=1 FL=1